MPERSDLALVQAATNGDADGFAELCQRYYPSMVAIAHSILGDRHLAEDTAQEAFAKAVRNWSQLKNKNKFAGWLAAICRNEARDLARKAGPVNNTKDLSTIAAKASNDGSIEAVRGAISRLPASDREVIFLRFYDGLSYEQASSVLGISTQAINGRLRRAKKKLADYLRRNGFAEV